MATGAAQKLALIQAAINAAAPFVSDQGVATLISAQNIVTAAVAAGSISLGSLTSLDGYLQKLQVPTGDSGKVFIGQAATVIDALRSSIVAGSGGVQPASQLGALAAAARYLNPRSSATVHVVLNTVTASIPAGAVGFNNTGISRAGYNQIPLYQNAGLFAVRGGVLGVATWAGGNACYSKFGTDKTGADQVYGGSFEFLTDEAMPIFTVSDWSNAWTVRVDGVKLDAVENSSSTGGPVDIQLDLTQLGGGEHTIELFAYDVNHRVYSMWVKPTATVEKPRAKPLMLAFTDSLGTTVNGGISCDAWPHVMGDWLGVEVLSVSNAGCGYIKTVNNLNELASAIASTLSLAAFQPLAIINALGINDGELDFGQVTAAAQSGIATQLQNWAGVEHFTLGSWASATLASQANQTALESALFAGLSGSGSKLIPVMTETLPWITGTGNADAPKGDGTADKLFKAGDSTHWSAAGHAIIGRRVANEILRAHGGI